MNLEHSPLYFDWAKIITEIGIECDQSLVTEPNQSPMMRFSVRLCCTAVNFHLLDLFHSKLTKLSSQHFMAAISWVEDF
jgi:hypothetical protein